PSCFPGFNFQSARSHEAPALPGVTRIHGRLDCTLPRIGIRDPVVSERIHPFRDGPADGLTSTQSRGLALTVFTNLAL
ncbi:unnamed protein product, partial [Ectocarpus sp. 8 AP-2014]